jgi:hypothetical protein
MSNGSEESASELCTVMFMRSEDRPDACSREARMLAGSVASEKEAWRAEEAGVDDAGKMSGVGLLRSGDTVRAMEHSMRRVEQGAGGRGSGRRVV